ncbi:MAG: hypothetical protein H0S85_16400 [Desulfovibrionaceae bacterium]|nr:hypothetical protein [Desulfovibrionaceae bacterium]
MAGEDKRFFLEAALWLLSSDGGHSHRDLLLKAVGGDKELGKRIDDFFKPKKQRVAPWIRKGHRRRTRETKRVEAWERKHCKDVVNNIGAIELGTSGLELGILNELRRYHDGYIQHISEYQPGLEKVLYTTAVMDAFLQGAVMFWRNWEPDPSEERLGDSLALFGFGYALRQGLPISSLTPQEAKRLFVLAQRDDYPKWFSALCKNHLGSLEGSISKQLAGVVNENSAEPYLPSLIRAVINDEGLFMQFHDQILADCEQFGPRLTWSRECLSRIAERNRDCMPRVSGICRAVLESARETDRHLWAVLRFKVDAVAALSWLQGYLETLDAAGQDAFMESFAASFDVSHGSNVRSWWSLCSEPSVLYQLIVLTQKHIRAVDDVVHEHGVVFSPGRRDHAQDFRGSLGGMLANVSGVQSYRLLEALREQAPEQWRKDFFARLIDDKLSRESEGEPWTERDLIDFERKYEIDPKNADDLFHITLMRLEEIKDEVENGDFGWRGLITPEVPEVEIQKVFAGKLREIARGRYSVSREEEVDDAKKPDIRISAATVTGKISIELKPAHKWSGPELVERLENQLVGQYLNGPDCKHGIFLLANAATGRQWECPQVAGRVDFLGLLAYLSNHAEAILRDRSDIMGLQVVGIDMTAKK